VSAKFPTAIATDADLLVMRNRKQTTLAAPLNASATTFTLTSDVFAADMSVTIEDEIIRIITKSGVSVTSCERGFDGTVAASHASLKLVSAFIDAHHHNQLADEVKAIEAALGVSMGNIPAVTYPIAVNKGGTGAITAAAARAALGAAALGANGDITSLSALSTPLSVAQGGTGAATLTGIPVGAGTAALSAVAAASELQFFRRKPGTGTTVTYEFASLPVLNAADYNFTTQTPGGSLTSGISNTITLAPVPPGVNASDTDHWLYITGGVGTAEAVKITGGTAVAGAVSGTIIFTPANNHSGAWTIQSATAGISEAIWSLSTPGGMVTVCTGTLTIHAPIRRRINMAIWVVGQWQESTTLAVASNFPTSGVNGVFDWSPGDTPAVPPHEGGGISRLTIQFTQPDSTNIATYTHWKPAFYASGGAVNPTVTDVDIYAAWDGITVDAATAGGVSGGTFRRIRMSAFHRGFSIDQSYDTMVIDDARANIYGLTANQITAYTSLTAPLLTFYVGRADDLKISNCLSYPGFANFHTGSDGGAAQAQLVNCWADLGGYTQTDGIVRISDSSLAGNLTAQQSVVFQGGQLYITNSRISNSVGYQAVYAVVTAGVASASQAYPPALQLVNCQILTLDGDPASPILYTTAAPYTGVFSPVLVGNRIERYADTAYTQPSVQVVAGTGDTQLTAVGNVFGDKGVGSGNAFTLTDSYHVITGNNGGGYSFTLAGATKAQWFGNLNFASDVNYLQAATKVLAKLSSTQLTTNKTENYIASETGANNAIAGALLDAAGVAVPLSAGLLVTILLGHTLQAGANTFALNGGAAKNIKSHRNAANNIATAYAATGIVTMVYDGTEWLDMSQ
jgi:hypothetical protein